MNLPAITSVDTGPHPHVLSLRTHTGVWVLNTNDKTPYYPDVLNVPLHTSVHSRVVHCRVVRSRDPPPGSGTPIRSPADPGSQTPGGTTTVLCAVDVNLSALSDGSNKVFTSLDIF